MVQAETAADPVEPVKPVKPVKPPPPLTLAGLPKGLHRRPLRQGCRNRRADRTAAATIRSASSSGGRSRRLDRKVIGSGADARRRAERILAWRRSRFRRSDSFRRSASLPRATRYTDAGIADGGRHVGTKTSRWAFLVLAPACGRRCDDDRRGRRSLDDRTPCLRRRRDVRGRGSSPTCGEGLSRAITDRGRQHQAALHAVSGYDLQRCRLRVKDVDLNINFVMTLPQARMPGAFSPGRVGLDRIRRFRATA